MRIATQAPAAGFSYLGVLLLLCVLAGASALTMELMAIQAQRQAEIELQAIGEEFNRAFIRYHRATPKGGWPWPEQLEDLLHDPRYPGTVRHLRRLYRGSFAQAIEWRPLAAPGRGIAGVYPYLGGTPLRQPRHTVNAPAGTVLEGAYAAWRFGYPLDAGKPAGNQGAGMAAGGTAAALPSAGAPLAGVGEAGRLN